jgi:hypothetical protein
MKHLPTSFMSISRPYPADKVRNFRSYRAVTAQYVPERILTLSSLYFRPHRLRYRRATWHPMCWASSAGKTGYYGVEEKYNDLLAGRQAGMDPQIKPGRMIPEVPGGSNLSSQSTGKSRLL